MKKIVCTLLAVAALAACTKSEVNYEAPAEIGFAPATENITKAAMAAGTLGTSEKIGVWAFWNGTSGSIAETNATYANYTDSYLSNAEFIYKNNTAWGGNGVAHPWPTNGALVFAGYTKPTKDQTDFSIAYTLNDNTTTTDVNEADVMTFTNFTQSTSTADTYDLCWFGRTSASYNNRADGEAVPVTLSHALTWITIQIKGKTENSLPVTAKWKVTNVTLNDIMNVGTGTCIGTTTSTTTDNVTTITPATATWAFASNAAKNKMSIYSGSKDITATATDIETTAKGTVIIPQTPTSVTVEWQYAVGNATKTETKTLPLTLGDGSAWKAGTHYTYTLVFDSNEILVAPSYSDWATSDQTVTVE